MARMIMKKVEIKESGVRNHVEVRLLPFYSMSITRKLYRMIDEVRARQTSLCSGSKCYAKGNPGDQEAPPAL